MSSYHHGSDAAAAITNNSSSSFRYASEYEINKRWGNIFLIY
jgi:hypothetical protein